MVWLSNEATDARRVGTRQCFLLKANKEEAYLVRLLGIPEVTELIQHPTFVPPESVCSKMSFLGVDEDRIVEQLKPELQKLVDSVMSLASTLVLAIITCTIVYIYRQMKEEKRAKELHSRRMVN